MSSRKRSSEDLDSPWKEALERYFPAFLEFFFSQAFLDIDWTLGYEFLDKELQQIVRDADLGRRLVDKLVKVWRKNGVEAWVLIHIEIQGQADSRFPERMYVYNYRLFDKYGRPAASMAVLADTQADWKPDRYEYELWGCRAGLRFPIVKLTDYEARWETLEANNNPFAIITVAHLKAQATRCKPDTRLQWKLKIVKSLYTRGYSRQDVLELFRFIDWVMVLPEAQTLSFDAELRQYAEEKKMAHVTSIERLAMARTRLQVLRESVLDGLDARFGAVPEALAVRIQAIDKPELLKTLHRRAITCDSLSEFEQSLGLGESVIDG